MPRWTEVVEAEEIDQDVLEVALPPRDVSLLPRRVITVVVADGDDNVGLQEAKIEVGPTASGPWFAEDIDASGIAGLDAGEIGVYRMDSADHWLRVRLRGATSLTKHTDVAVYLDSLSY